MSSRNNTVDKKKNALPQGSLNRPKSFFNFLPKLKDTGYDSDYSTKTEIIDKPYGPEEKSDMLNMKIPVDSTPEKTKEEFIYDPPPTRILSYNGDELFHDEIGIHPVTSITFKQGVIYYKKMVDENGKKTYTKIVPYKPHFDPPYNRSGDARRNPPEFVFKDDIIMDDEKVPGGKRRRKTIQKPKRKTRKTRRYKRRHTRKYK